MRGEQGRGCKRASERRSAVSTATKQLCCSSALTAGQSLCSRESEQPWCDTHPSRAVPCALTYSMGLASRRRRASMATMR